MCICLHVKYPLFLSDFHETGIFPTDLRKIFKYQISWKILPVRAGLLLADSRTDGSTDMAKLIEAFCNFANAPRMMWFLWWLNQNKKKKIICYYHLSMFLISSLCNSRWLTTIDCYVQTIDCYVQTTHISDNELCNIWHNWNEDYVHNHAWSRLTFTRTDLYRRPDSTLWFRRGHSPRSRNPVCLMRVQWFFKCCNNEHAPVLSKEIKKSEFNALVVYNFHWGREGGRFSE
jgi:hypothetical protein